MFRRDAPLLVSALWKRCENGDFKEKVVNPNEEADNIASGVRPLNPSLYKTKPRRKTCVSILLRP